MIKKITSIKNIAVFTDFEWDSSVLDGDGRPIDLKPLSIVYGRNYSGKTTLSRIVRSLQTGHISTRYDMPKYNLLLTDGTTVTEEDPRSHSLVVRVFNDDFVRENLRVFLNEDEGVAAFAVLGEDNAEIIAQLTKKEDELGSEDQAGSLRAQLAEQLRGVSDAEKKHKAEVDAVDGLLTDKARAIKDNTNRYSDPRYTIRKIKVDMESVSKDSYERPSDEELAKFEATLSETEKPKIGPYPAVTLKWDRLYSSAKALLDQVVVPMTPIADLLDDPQLQRWVDEGRDHHRDKRETCAFCENILHDSHWDRLDGHFSKESKVLEIKLGDLLSEIDNEIAATDGLLSLDKSTLYNTFADTANGLIADIDAWRKGYRASLSQLRDAIKTRRDDVFTTVAMPDVINVSNDIQGLRDRAEELRRKNNDYTASLAVEKTKARDVLRLTEVSLFIETIKYDEKKEQITKSEADVTRKQALCDEYEGKVREAQEVIAELKTQLRDERNGAEKVNQYLSHYFGHPSLRLEAMPEEGADDGKVQYRFEIQREGAKAYHLSEGEKGLIAFCYFMGRLEDVDTTGTKPVIWIDDPISSLDENHIFFIYSLIQSHILDKDMAGQLVISTHSLAFLKYLRRLSGSIATQRSYFVVERLGNSSTLKPMPKHLKLFSTEFHYLFDCLYRCAKADPYDGSNVDVFYSFGNNVRKFLEMYLYFRFPNAVDEHDRGSRGSRRINRFLGDDNVSASLAERIENEYSHLHGLFERGATPVDIPAMQKMAQLVLDKIKEHDPEQFDALLQSIGISKEDDASGESI